MEFDDASAALCLFTQLCRCVGILRVHRKTHVQPSAEVRRGNGGAPVFGQAVAKGQTQLDGQQESVFHTHGIHLPQEIGRGLGKRELTAPQALRHGVTLQPVERFGCEVRVGVDIEVQLAFVAGLVAVQQVAHTRRAGG